MNRHDLEVLIRFLKMPVERAEPVFDMFSELPGAVRRGNGPEQFLFIRGTRDDRVLLVAHADTFWDVNYRDSQGSIPPALRFQDGKLTNANGGLGADDRAGCAMIWLLRETGHSILVTHGEECGRRGSTWLMNENHDIADEINLNHRFVVQFDRRNGNEFKCYCVGTDPFRNYVRSKTGYSEPDYLSSTDIVTLCRDVCGVNLSTGYRHEHTEDECLDVYEWLNTLKICRKWLSESDLPRFSRNENNG